MANGAINQRHLGSHRWQFTGGQSLERPIEDSDVGSHSRDKGATKLLVIHGLGAAPHVAVDGLFQPYPFAG